MMRFLKRSNQRTGCWSRISNARVLHACQPKAKATGKSAAGPMRRHAATISVKGTERRTWTSSAAPSRSSAGSTRRVTRSLGTCSSGVGRAGGARWGEAREALPSEGGRERPPLIGLGEGHRAEDVDEQRRSQQKQRRLDQASQATAGGAQGLLAQRRVLRRVEQPAGQDAEQQGAERGDGERRGHRHALDRTRIATDLAE